VINKIYGGNVGSEWTNITVGDEKWETHVIFTKKIMENKTTILLLHGYGATSTLAWRGVIPNLLGNYNMIAVDLPGYGRSKPSKKLLNAADVNVLLNLYCEFYYNFFHTYNLQNIYVVAHSFGGFIFTHCASRWPHLVSRLLLADVPGFFSINGGWDYAWASFFILGFPHTGLKLLGNVGLIMSKFIVNIFDFDPAYTKYWYHVRIFEF
jgi:pimeloyl-ACP methyl ester carboxylesterase